MKATFSARGSLQGEALAAWQCLEAVVFGSVYRNKGTEVCGDTKDFTRPALAGCVRPKFQSRIHSFCLALPVTEWLHV
jgi:hypothetical protein